MRQSFLTVSRVLLVVAALFVPLCARVSEQQNTPVATAWTLDAAGPTQRNAIKSVVMLVCPKTSSKGSAFVLKSGSVGTAAHVVEGCVAGDVIGIDAAGKQFRFSKLVEDKRRDLALLRPAVALSGGLDLAPDKDPDLGSGVSTWGFPLGFNGPAPLLSVGYMAGFKADGDQASPVKHLVVNGAFNPGNSGGPLFLAGGDKIIGVVVSKHAPLTPFVVSAIDVLSKNSSGVVFEYADGQGNKKQFVESQIVAEVLTYFRNLSQVMIGEAVAVSELRAFMNSREKEIQ